MTRLRQPMYYIVKEREGDKQLSNLLYAIINLRRGKVCVSLYFFYFSVFLFLCFRIFVFAGSVCMTFHNTLTSSLGGGV